MCKDHETAVYAADASVGPTMRKSEEFARLDLPEQGCAYHCEEHDHSLAGRPTRLFIGGGVTAILGLIVAFASAVPGVLLLLAGCAVIAVAVKLDRDRHSRLLSERPPAPLDAELETVQLVETITGEIELGDEGGYEPSAPSLAGALGVVLSWPKSELERLQRYRKRFALEPATATPYAAGFLRLVGRAGIEWGSETVTGASRLDRLPVLALHGSTADHEFLDRDASGSAPTTRIQMPYSPQALRKLDRLPLTIVPTLQPESGRRTLRLDIQWLPLGDPDAIVAKDAPTLPVVDLVEEMELHVPLSWGNVDGVEPEAISHRDGTANGDRSAIEGTGSAAAPVTRRITWERLAVASSSLDHGSAGGVDGYRHVTVTVRFEKPIDTDQVITGRVIATSTIDSEHNQPTAGLLSGIRGVVLHDSRGGNPRKQLAQLLVRVDVGFSLSLRNLRYQERRVAPDLGRGTDEDLTEAETVFGVVPDYETIVTLTNALSKTYYVKGVVEHPPKTGAVRTHTNRSWDVIGRHYEGVYPIDFHITLTGEEVSGEVGRRSGKTELRVSTSGVHTYKPLDEDESGTLHVDDDVNMEKAIRDCQERLHEASLAVLERIKAARSHLDDELEAEYGGARIVRAIGAGRHVVAHEGDVVDAELVEDETGASRGGHAPLQLDPPRPADPAERRRRITDSLLDGRISEQTYNRLIAELEAEEATEAGA